MQKNNMKNPKSFLERVTVANLSQRESALKSVKNRAVLEPLYGDYRGPINFTKKRPRGRIQLVIKEGATPEAEPTIRIEVTDGVTPKTIHIGGLNQLKRLVDGSNGYFIEPSDRSQLQFYFVNDNMQAIGNFYEKNRNGLYDRIGTFRLTRVPE